MAIWPEVPGGGAAPAREREGRPAPDDWRPGDPFPFSGPGSRRSRRSSRRRPSRLALLALLIALAGLAASAAAVVADLLPRSFTTAQQQRIAAWEVGARWRTWPAGRIFPPAVRYRLPPPALASLTGLDLTAHRAGIAPQAACRRAADPVVARVLIGHGCLAVLRATYADATGSMAVTVGIAVFPGAAAARAAAAGLPQGTPPRGVVFRPGVRAVRFAGTAAASFGQAERQLTWAGSSGPYLILAGAGYADGRPRVHESTTPYSLIEMRSMAEGVAGSVGSGLAAPPPPAACPGTPGC